MSEQSSTTRAYDSPLRLLAIVAASVFGAEALVMVFLMLLPPLPHAVAAPLDAALVTILVYPILYRFMLRPMTQQLDERRRAEDALRQIQDELESRIRERTAELAQANESLQIQVAERQRAGEGLKVALDLVQQRQTEMAALLVGARAVLEYRDFSQVAQAIFEACRSTIGAAAGFVALPTADRSGEKSVFSNLGEQAGQADLALFMPVVGMRQQAYATGKTLYTNDAGHCACAQWLPGGHVPLHNILFAPLTIKGFVVGTLGLANKPGGFSDDDARLASAFAELAAIAVLNSQTIGLLESSERRFRTLAQATFEGIAISEGEFIREANEQFARMHGYTLPEVLGRPIADFLAPEDHARMQQSITGDEMHVGEYHALRKDGSVFPLEVRTYSMEQGGRARRVAALRDITERQQAEEAIRARTALLASIIESPDSAIFSIDREYCYTSFNRRHAYVMQSLFGVEIEIGRNLLDYHTVASNRQSAKQNLDRALAGESFVIEDWAGDDALTRRYFEISHNPVKDADQIIGAAVFAQDITERKYADQMLRENEEWLRLAFDAGDLGRWRFSATTGMLHFDERARIHSGSIGYSVAQAEALTRVHPDDRALLQEQTMNALHPAGQGRYAVEYRVRWPDGEMHWLAVQARVHFEGEGETRRPVLAVGISQDITARKQMEQALRESEERFRLALRNAPVSIAAQDRDLRFLWAYNQRTVDPKDVIGKTDADLFPPDDAARLIALKRAVLETSTERREQLWLTSGGQRVFLDLYLEPMRDASGQVTGIRIATVDLTQMKLAEEALRQSRSDLDRAQKVGQIGSWRLDVRHNVLTWSDENHRIFGVPKGTPMTYDTFLGSIHPDDRANVDREWTAGLAGKPYDIEHRIIVDGGVKWVRERAYLEFDQDGVLLGGFGITQDITERKRVEEQLRATLESIGDGFLAYDAGWRFVYVNTPAERMLGLRREELLDRCFWDVFPLTVGTDLEREYRRAAAGEIRDFENFYEPWGRWFHNRCFPREGGGLSVYFEDITARKQTEDRITWLASFPELNPNPVVEVDLAGYLHYLNPVAKRLLPDLETRGLAHPWLSDLESLGQKLQAADTTVLTREVVLGEAVYQQALSYVPNSRRVRIYSLDITARKHAEEFLRRQAALIDLSPDAIIVRRLDGIVTFWSQGAETLYGWKESEALGRQVSDLLQARLSEPLEDIVEQLKQTGRWSGEIVHHTRGGLQVIVQSWWLAQFNAQGDIIEIFESNVDFTARKQMEEQLRHTQALLERRVLERTAELAAANNELRLQSAALQAAANGIIITDRQGNIQWANPALTAMTGYTAAEVLGQSTRLFRGGPQEPEFYQHLWNTILSGQVWRGELINRRKDGSLYVEEQTISPVWNEQGEIANFVAVKQDVTERKEAQARLEQNNRDLQALSNAERRARLIAETLSAANLALTQSLDLETVMEALLDYMYQLVPYDSANIMLLETEERLVVRTARGYETWTDPQLTRTIFFDAHGNRTFHELISTQHSVLIPETRAHLDWEVRPGAEHVRSWLGVPIVAGGHVIGVYSLDKVTPDFFTAEHVRLAEALVGQAAVAIQNAWLFDQLRAGRERLQSLSRRLVEVQEAERHYVARELHDEAGQALTSLVYGLGELERETVPAQRALRLAESEKDGP